MSLTCSLIIIIIIIIIIMARVWFALNEWISLSFFRIWSKKHRLLTEDLIILEHQILINFL